MRSTGPSIATGTTPSLRGSCDSVRTPPPCSAAPPSRHHRRDTGRSASRRLGRDGTSLALREGTPSLHPAPPSRSASKGLGPMKRPGRLPTLRTSALTPPEDDKNPGLSGSCRSTTAASPDKENRQGDRQTDASDDDGWKGEVGHRNVYVLVLRLDAGSAMSERRHGRRRDRCRCHCQSFQHVVSPCWCETSCAAPTAFAGPIRRTCPDRPGTPVRPQTSAGVGAARRARRRSRLRSLPTGGVLRSPD